MVNYSPYLTNSYLKDDIFNMMNRIKKSLILCSVKGIEIVSENQRPNDYNIEELKKLDFGQLIIKTFDYLDDESEQKMIISIIDRFSEYMSKISTKEYMNIYRSSYISYNRSGNIPKLERSLDKLNILVGDIFSTREINYKKFNGKLYYIMEETEYYDRDYLSYIEKGKYYNAYFQDIKRKKFRLVTNYQGKDYIILFTEYNEKEIRLLLLWLNFMENYIREFCYRKYDYKWFDSKMI